MNEATLPPSPNWYLCNILGCSSNGTVAWGARNMIVVAKPNENELILEYSIIKNAHKTKVACLAFTPQFEEVTASLVASTGTDNVIKIWNTETLSLVYSHVLEADKQAIAVDWSHKEPNVIHSVTSDGYALSLNIHFNTVSSISLGKVTPTCISSCPHDPHLVAIGSKSGLVYIVSFQGKGQIIYKLRGHDTEVISLSWCPSEDNVLYGSTNKDLLLASGGKDREIFIWRAGGNGRYEMTIPMPTGPLDSHQHRSKLNASVGNWVVVDWIEPKLLLTSSLWGELMSWDLSTMTRGKPTVKLIHAYHSRGLFCIAHAPSSQETQQENWRKKQRHHIWTLAQDRRVICCGIQDNSIEIDYDIYTQGGYVYCIAACPLDTSQVAFGVGDAMLRLWNLSEPHSTSFAITVLWQKIKGKIRAIAWHPEKENLLAYATEEGRVGVFNTNGNKPPILYRQYHRSTVYSISWGPGAGNKCVLYTCGEGELVYYDPEKPKLDPTCILKKECTEFSWKPDFSCLAVGFDNGTISFLDRNFETRGQAKFSSEMVHCLVWHPESTATDVSLSPLRNYLAVAYKSSTITIFDLTNLMDHFAKLERLTDNDDTSNKSDIYKVHEVATTLTGHVHSVVCLAWSPYSSAHLISGSYDGTAQVWNIETQELIATYTGHSGPVTCCMWSPLDPDYVITGSADFTLRIWKVAYNPPQEETRQKVPKELKKQRSRANKVKDGTLQNGVVELTESISECSISNVSHAVQAAKEVKKKSGRSSYFAKSSKTTDTTFLLNSLLNIVRKIKGEDIDVEQCQDNSYHMISVLFSSKEDLTSFLTSEKNTHLENNKHDHVTEMDVWCDNLKQNLDDAAKEKRLTDFLVSLSASLSMKTWKDMCELYAQQLITEGKPHKAVSYLLCIHKTYKAIEVYQDANFYKEAYVLARCKLEPDDPILTNILKNWATYSVYTGNFEQAAYIYAKLGEFSEIVKYLSRRKHAETLITAAEIAQLCNIDDTSKSLSEQAILTAFTNSEYDIARNIIVKFPYLKYQEIYLFTLEEIDKIITKDVKFDTIQIWINGQANYGLLQTLETVCGNCTSYYNELCQSNACNNLENERMLTLAFGCEFARAIASANTELKLKHVTTALHIISQYETMHRNEFEDGYSLLVEIVVKLDSKSLTAEDSIYAKTEYPVSASLRAYLCYALLNWLVQDKDKEVIGDNVQTYIDLIENLLEDALNKQTVEYWSITNKISKLEMQVVSAMCKTTTKEEDKDEKPVDPLMDELNALKAQRKRFLNEIVYVPNPVMVYSKANEVCSKLQDKCLMSKFSEAISKIWMNATT